MNFRELSEKRRAINFFDPKKDVSDQLLGEMIELAVKTPSSFNLQPWNLLVLRDREKKRKTEITGLGPAQDCRGTCCTHCPCRYNGLAGRASDC